MQTVEAAEAAFIHGVPSVVPNGATLEFNHEAKASPEPIIKKMRLDGEGNSKCPVRGCGKKIHRGQSVSCQFHMFVQMDIERSVESHPENDRRVRRLAKESIYEARRRVFSELNPSLCEYNFKYFSPIFSRSLSPVLMCWLATTSLL